MLVNCTDIVMKIYRATSSSLTRGIEKDSEAFVISMKKGEGLSKD